MRISAGQQIPQIELQGIDGKTFNSQSLKGRPYMLSFFRFATCPFCNMRIHQLTTQYKQFSNDFSIIAIFDSPLEHLTKYASKHQAPFPILADESNQYYKSFAIERSYLGILKGMFFRLPTLIQGMFKGYLPLVIKGNIATMPADFLIDADGIVQTAYYGTDEGDHLSIEKVIQFSQQN
jgi:peroxiredoxin